MEPSKVYFTDFRTRVFSDSIQNKLMRLIKAAGIDRIDFKNKFVAIKIHFGEPGNLAFLRPNYARTIVDYTREPFIYRPGNVRVTFDYNIRTGLSCTDFLNTDCITVPAGDPVVILEVKWDEYLPSIIRDAVQTPGRRVTAFSKYAQCRIYD